MSSKYPEWATAKVRFYLATCWFGVEGDEDCPSLEGLRWWDDLLLVVCTWFHNWFVQPLCEDEGFPLRLVEAYPPLGPLRSEEAYGAAIARVQHLWGAPAGTPGGDELDELLDRVAAYEEEHHPVPVPCGKDA